MQCGAINKMLDERTMTFQCHGDTLYGILSPVAATCKRGVLIVVGGPQYRVGSNRQFTLLARALAKEGIAAMRFDYRGMGDSEGELRQFDETGEDLRAAVNAFMEAVPGMREVVLWGLCDAASAVTLYAANDDRVTGLVMLNPWVRTADSLARTTLRHYYRERLLDGAFWRQLLKGRLNLSRSFKSLLDLARAARKAPSPANDGQATALPDRMHASMQGFKGRVMIVISGADLTGREFSDLIVAAPKWKRLLEAPGVTRHQIDKADHTFSRAAWRDQVAAWTATWVRSW